MNFEQATKTVLDLAISKSIRLAVGGSGRKIEIEPGVWVDYGQWQLEQQREKRFWEGREISEEDRAANIARLRQAIDENLRWR